MNASPVQTKLQATSIQHARVLDVDMGSYTVTVSTEFSKKPLSGISFATPYQHFANGEGIYFMPEVGSLCWVCEPSDGSRPFVIAWAPAEEEGDFRARKQNLNPGDIYLGTRDENFIVLRRGGIVQIGGGPLSQRLFLPVQNMIKDICENYSLLTLAGDLEWTVGREEDTTDGKRPSSLTIKARQFSNDKEPIASLKIGSHGEGSDTILSLEIKESGSEGATTKISLTMEKTGNVVFDIKKDMSLVVDGKLGIEVRQDISVKSKTGKVEIEGSTEANVKGAQATIEANAKVTVKGGASASIEAPLIQLGGDGATSPAVKGDQLLIWLSSHTHNATSIGAPTSPPIQAGALSNIVSTTVLVK